MLAAAYGRIPLWVRYMAIATLMVWNVAWLLHGVAPRGWWIGGVISIGLTALYRFIKHDLVLPIAVGSCGAWLMAGWLYGPSQPLSVIYVAGVGAGWVYAIWKRESLFGRAAQEVRISLEGIVRRWESIRDRDAVKRVLAGSTAEMIDADTIRVFLAAGRSLTDVLKIRERIESAIQVKDQRLERGSLHIYPDDKAGCVQLCVAPSPPSGEEGA